MDEGAAQSGAEWRDQATPLLIIFIYRLSSSMSIIHTETFFCWPETKPGGLSHVNSQLTGSLARITVPAISIADLFPPPHRPQEGN